MVNVHVDVCLVPADEFDVEVASLHVVIPVTTTEYGFLEVRQLISLTEPIHDPPYPFPGRLLGTGVPNLQGPGAPLFPETPKFVNLRQELVEFGPAGLRY
jgi:hypothetical protein